MEKLRKAVDDFNKQFEKFEWEVGEKNSYDSENIEAGLEAVIHNLVDTASIGLASIVKGWFLHDKEEDTIKFEGYLLIQGKEYAREITTDGYGNLKYSNNPVVTEYDMEEGKWTRPTMQNL